MGTMRFLLLLSLIPLAFGFKCKDILNKPTKCCSEPKKLDCWTVANNPDAACTCSPTNGAPEAYLAEEPCEWGATLPRFAGATAIIPCQGFTKTCPYNPATKVIECAPSIDGLVDYPPREHHFRRVANGEEAYCKMEADGKMLTGEDFYKTFLTCWVFDCLPRLRKPPGMEDKKGNDWCLPPLDTTKRLMFATNYCDPKAVDKPAENCVLLPLCNSEVYAKDKTRVIDSKKYMSPLKGDSQTEVDNGRCQLLCPADTNDGLWESEPCVRRPPCQTGDAPKTEDSATVAPVAAAITDSSGSTVASDSAAEPVVEPKKDSKNPSDPMEVGQEYCLPWCSFDKKPSEEDYKKSGRANNCINRPICTDEAGTMPEPDVNIHGSEYCVPSRKCTGNSATHFCQGEETTTEPTPDSAGLGSTWTIIIIVVCVFVVAAIGAFVYWFFFFRKRNNDDTTLDTKTAVVDPELAKAEAKVENPTEANLLAKKHRLDHTQNEQQPSVSQANKDKDGVMKKASMPTYYKPESGEEQKDKKESKEKDSKEKSSKIGKEGKEAKSEKKEKSEKKDKERLPNIGKSENAYENLGPPGAPPA